MENPLSQADIDSLARALASVADGKNGDRAVKSYDFRRPTKFSKDLLRTLEMVHDNFARLLQGFFLGSLRTRAQLQVRTTNQYSYAEFVGRLPSHTVVAAFHMEPLPGTCLLEISQNIAYAAIDRVFGGPGADVQPDRGLTEIELGVVQRIVTDMFGPLQEAWNSVAELKPVLESMETNPMFLQSSSPSEVLAVINLGIQVGEHMGHMTLAFPYSTVDPVLSRLSPHNWLAAERSAKHQPPPMLEQTIYETPVTLRVHLGSTRVTVSEFSQLKVGDVIPLDTDLQSELPIMVGHHLTYLGRPGLVRNRMAIHIQRRVGEGA
jgi:flagellar motor switch protein FliM